MEYFYVEYDGYNADFLNNFNENVLIMTMIFFETD